MTQDFRAIIPAGGAGTRLWPLSRARRPKYLLDLTGAGRTLLQATWDRLVPLTGPAGITVVTGTAHVEAARAQLPDLTDAQVLAEPAPRDSMAAIGLAAAVLARREGDIVIGSFAADHVIRDQDRFAAAVRSAVAVAREGYVATIGITPTRPSTAFGYIRAGADLGLDAAPGACRATSFTEKPDAGTAGRYLAQGGYRWNAGMFIVRAQVLLDHLRAQLPTLHDGLLRIAAAWDTPRRAAVLAETWPGLPRIAIDHAIAEPVAAAGGVAVVPGDFDWDDVGDFAALRDLLPAAGGVHVLGDGDLVLARDAAGALVAPGTGRAVAVLGVPEAVVVDTPDAVLVTTRAHAQRVRELVEELRERGADDLR